jgi:hypothetical protein
LGNRGALGLQLARQGILFIYYFDGSEDGNQDFLHAIDNLLTTELLPQPLDWKQLKEN